MTTFLLFWAGGSAGAWSVLEILGANDDFLGEVVFVKLVVNVVA